MADTENKNLENSSSTPQINETKNQTITTQNNSEYSATNEKQSNQDFTKIFSENINVEPEIPQNAQEYNNNQEQSPQHTEPGSTLINEKIDTPENKVSEIQGQPNTGVQTTQTSTENNQEKAQKEKLIQLIKVHEIKAQKKGLTKGILYGIALTIGIFALSIIFAKEQILNLLNNQNKNTLPLNASIVELSNENVQDDNEIESDLLTGNILETGDNQDITGSIITEDKDNSENNNINENNKDNGPDNITEENKLTEENKEENDETIIVEDNFEENIIEENITEDNQEKINETVKNDNEENEQNENNKVKKYTITHVHSEEEANYVLPVHCTDLTCYGEDKEFSPCTTFRLSETLDENSNRIGKNGVCRYKNNSELVYVESSNEENENNLNNNEEIEEKEARDASRKSALSQLETAIVTYMSDTGMNGRAGLDKGATSGITISKINKELMLAGMKNVPLDPISSTINYGLGILNKNNSTIGEYTYLITKGYGVNNAGFVLMASTETEKTSNWIVCENKSGIENGYITNDTDVKDIKVCKQLKKGNSCSTELCTYTNEDELRYIRLYNN